MQTKYGAKDHPDVDELHKRVSEMDSKISIATVYRTVKLFEESGILTKHEFKGGKARYEELNEGHHDHLIDVRSGEIIEFVDEEIEKLNPNTIGGYIDDIKQFINSADKKGLKTSLEIKLKDFYSPTNETNDIYLKEDEISKTRIELDSNASQMKNLENKIFFIEKNALG